MMRVFVTDGTGFVGSRLIKRLIAEKHEVSALANSEDDEKEVRKMGAKPISGTLEELKKWYEHLGDVDCVVHNAAPEEFWGVESNFEKVIFKFTKHLFRAAIKYKVKRFIYLSSCEVLYGNKPLEGIDEKEPYPSEPNSFHSKYKMETEKFLTTQECEVKTIILRAPYIWGLDSPSFDLLERKVNTGKFIWIDEGDLPFEAVHVDNLVEAITLALDKGEDKKIYFVTDDEKYSVREFLDKLFHALGYHQPEHSVPGWLAKPITSASDFLWRKLRLKSHPPVTKYELSFVSLRRRFKLDQIKEDLGYKPVRDSESGLRELFEAEVSQHEEDFES